MTSIERKVVGACAMLGIEIIREGRWTTLQAPYGKTFRHTKQIRRFTIKSRSWTKALRNIGKLEVYD